MDIDSLDIPDEPERFKELCEKIGLALIMTQEAHVSLCLYDVSYRVHKGQLEKEQFSEKLNSKLDNKKLTMGVIAGNIKKYAPLSGDLSRRVELLVDDRNWLAHRLNQELTPLVLARSRGEEFDISPLICKLDNIANQACEIVFELNVIGNELMPN